MKDSLIDVPVLLIFMARPNQFRQVFEQVRKARPSKLFLYQDGARKGVPEDIQNIKECRKIAENIDWRCEIYKMYQKENIGCDPSEYIAQKWMFSQVDRGIILEDDDVPSQSFFTFCKEMLDKYFHDTRINYISGMNHLGTYDNGTPASYFFSSTGSIWGWATWRRTIDLWDEHLEFLNNPHILSLLKMIMGKHYFNHKIQTWQKHKKSGIAYYESIHGASALLNSQLNIIPKKNLISNIGISSDNTHSTDSLKHLPKRIRKVFFMETYELNTPLSHPKYVINDMHYLKMVNKMMGNDLSLPRSSYNYLTLFLYKIRKKIRSLI